uniref:Uncharacterized protein n=1 Tax=Siphoviridae sp. ctRcp9 TaxID=2825504 RepID=A0A8S5PKL7_9CAUD|nr:MAG TPA: hypothetical protein [Siphoviridae sp. ctRcp9]
MRFRNSVMYLSVCFTQLENSKKITYKKRI